MTNTTKDNNHKDPVCGMDVPVTENSIIFNYKDQIVYFCSEHCHNEFVKSPEVYQKRTSSFLKRWWNGYLARLNKLTGGKAQHCC